MLTGGPGSQCLHGLLPTCPCRPACCRCLLRSQAAVSRCACGKHTGCPVCLSEGRLRAYPGAAASAEGAFHEGGTPSEPVRCVGRTCARACPECLSRAENGRSGDPEGAGRLANEKSSKKTKRPLAPVCPHVLGRNALYRHHERPRPQDGKAQQGDSFAIYPFAASGRRCLYRRLPEQVLCAQEGAADKGANQAGEGKVHSAPQRRSHAEKNKNLLAAKRHKRRKIKPAPALLFSAKNAFRIFKNALVQPLS